MFGQPGIIRLICVCSFAVLATNSNSTLLELANRQAWHFDKDIHAKE